MSKDELLLQVVKAWWDCIREEEIEESLNGDMDSGDVLEHYPNFEDEPDEAIEQMQDDVRHLFMRLREQFKEKFPQPKVKLTNVPNSGSQL